jgi:isopenicillin-N epimerase
MTPVFGHAGRNLWSLREDGCFLNHGSYGAVPRSVQDEHARLRHEMEHHPDTFFDHIKPTGSARAPRQVAAALARFTGTEGDRIALVENATTGVQAVLNSLPLAPGDEILGTNQQYNAVRLAVEVRCKHTGATPRTVQLPLPAIPGDITQRVLDALTARTRLVVLDHITSTSALILPLAQIVPELQRRGIPVFIDGAHAIGQLPLDIPLLGVDWYVTNAHKWLYAPRGSAMLWASENAAPHTIPVLTSHYIGMGFPHSFDYIGTRDYTAWLAIPAALAFFESLGPEELWQHEGKLVDAGSRELLKTGAVAAGTRQMCAAMRAFILPQRRAATAADAAAVMQTLWDKERIQIRCAIVDGKLLLRFSAQAYVAEQDLVQLGAALQRHGWPDRT